MNYKLYLMLRIKEVIKEKGFSISDIAEKMGITQPALSSIINGNPTAEKLEQIASILNISASEFFDQPATDIINCPYCGGKIKVSKE